MKKVISVREIIIILISILVVTISTNVYATGLSLGNNNTNNETISGDAYKEWQNIQEDKNGIGNNSNNNSNTNNSNTNNSNTKVYNTNKNTDLPQTGIEDYNIGILLIICIGSAIFAYKKVSDYKNI